MNKYRIYFTRSTSGFHVRVEIGREPNFPTPHHGVLCRGREMTCDQALEYAQKHAAHHPRRNDYEFIIDVSGLD